MGISRSIDKKSALGISRQPQVPNIQRCQGGRLCAACARGECSHLKAEGAAREFATQELTFGVLESGFGASRQITISQPAHLLDRRTARIAVAGVATPQQKASKAIPRRGRTYQISPDLRTHQGPTLIQLLGANPGCTHAQRDAIHQAIFNARGWLNKAIPQLEADPLSSRVTRSLGRNFGPTYGVAANAPLITGRLRRVLREISTIPFSCTGAANATCGAGHCGFAAAAGGHSATICSNVTLAAGTDWRFQAGCVLHESFHAAFSRFTVDEYSGWHGVSGSTPTYPGAGTDPLLNADSYTTLVMDLS